MAEGRWTEKQRVLVRVWVQDYVIRMHGRPFDKPLDTEIDELLDAVFLAGEPDEQKSTEGLLNAVERLNGQKDALRRENGQLRELLDLPIGERVEAVAELAGEPDDEWLIARVAEALRNEECSEAPSGWDDEPGWAKTVYRKQARAAVAAVRAAGPGGRELEEVIGRAQNRFEEITTCTNEHPCEACMEVAAEGLDDLQRAVGGQEKPE